MKSKTATWCLLGCVAASFPVVHLCSAQGDDGEYHVREVATRLHAIEGRGGNSVVLADPSETLVVNCKFARHAQEFEKRVQAFGGGPWRWLVLTDHRPETADAVSALPKDVKVLAHHRTDERLRAAGKRGADLTFDSTVNLRIGGKMVTIQHKGAAQTDGVIYAHFHEQQVLALGDLVSNQTHPSLWPDEGGSIRAALRVLKDLRKDYKSSAALRIVPGLGEPGPHALFDETIGYWTALLDLGIEAHRHGLSVSEAQASGEPLRLKYAAWRGDRFTKNVAIAYAETNQ